MRDHKAPTREYHEAAKLWTPEKIIEAGEDLGFVVKTESRPNWSTHMYRFSTPNEKKCFICLTTTEAVAFLNGAEMAQYMSSFPNG